MLTGMVRFQPNTSHQSLDRFVIQQLLQSRAETSNLAVADILVGDVTERNA